MRSTSVHSSQRCGDMWSAPGIGADSNIQPEDLCLTEEEFKEIQATQPDFYMMGPIELLYDPEGVYAQDLAKQHAEKLGKLTFLGDLDQSTVSWARNNKGEFFLLGPGYQFPLGNTWGEATNTLITRIKAADAGDHSYCY
eukprot:TRINITY_DN6311_c0_g1_i1.p1 TRINITY_DN6311_c0_g1~~TRINITY_DN6311_c0_g1_i1.p1  ORF type:complete len:140 (+),score=29.53 TRINITY_DN6311_c0_g1_i1:92-511(+)